MSELKKYCKPIRLSEKADKLLTEESHKKKSSKQDILNNLILKYIGNIEPVKKIPKILTKDMVLEGHLDMKFTFDDINFDNLSAVFLTLLETIKEYEADLFLIVDSVEGLDVKINIDKQYKCNTKNRYPEYHITKENMVELKPYINSVSWNKIYSFHENGNSAEVGVYYKLKNSIEKLEKIIDKEDIETIKTKLDRYGKITENELKLILDKYINNENIDFETRRDLLRHINSKKVESTFMDYWGKPYFESDYDFILKYDGLNEKEIQIFKEKTRIPIPNQDHKVLLQYIKELIYLHNAKVMVNIIPIKELVQEIEHEGPKMYESKGLQRDLTFNYDNIRNTIITTIKN